jgi:hypothetical protein
VGRGTSSGRCGNGWREVAAAEVGVPLTVVHELLVVPVCLRWRGYNVVNNTPMVQVLGVQARLVEPMDRVQVQRGSVQVCPGFSDRGLQVPTDLTLEDLNRELVVPIDKTAKGTCSL